jgi:hypothetical protein
MDETVVPSRHLDAALPLTKTNPAWYIELKVREPEKIV